MSTSSGTAEEKKITNLAAIVGRWKFAADGEAVCEGRERPELPYGLCVSNVRFLEGEAKVTVHPNDAGLIDGKIVFGYRSEKDEYFNVGVHSEGKAYRIVHYNPAIGWYPLVEAGLAENLAVGRPIRLRVVVRGQRVSLEVDGVRVLEYVLPVPLPFGQLGLYSWLSKGANFKFTDFSTTQTTRGDAFVVMQLSGFEELYSDVVEPLIKEFDLHPYRADQVYGPGSVLEDIIRGIETAQIVIAEITPANENVYYEVG